MCRGLGHPTRLQLLLFLEPVNILFKMSRIFTIETDHLVLVLGSRRLGDITLQLLQLKGHELGGPSLGTNPGLCPNGLPMKLSHEDVLLPIKVMLFNDSAQDFMSPGTKRDLNEFTVSSVNSLIPKFCWKACSNRSE